MLSHSDRDLALRQDEHTSCPSCGGQTGGYDNQGAWWPCVPCKGTGYRTMEKEGALVNELTITYHGRTFTIRVDKGTYGWTEAIAESMPDGSRYGETVEWDGSRSLWDSMVQSSVSLTSRPCPSRSWRSARATARKSYSH